MRALTIRTKAERSRGGYFSSKTAKEQRGCESEREGFGGDGREERKREGGEVGRGRGERERERTNKR